MKKSIIALLMFPVASLVANPYLHVDSYKLDVANSKVEWYAEKVTGKHNGTIQLKSGNINNDHGNFSGKFIMDMTTLQNSDLDGATKTKLETHLKSDDFFGVEKHPESTFEFTSLTPITGSAEAAANFTVKGNLTVKGITKEITFPATIKFEGAKMTAKADVTINRAEFDIRYGSKTFFPEIGDKAIMDDFLLKIDLVLNKQ